MSLCWSCLVLVAVALIPLACTDRCAGSSRPDGGSAEAGADGGAGDALPDPSAPPSGPWARSIGGEGDDEALAVALGPAGEVIVAGRLRGTATVALPAGPLEVRGRGRADAFVARLDPDGELTWLRSFGGAGDDDALGVAVGSDGAVAVVGGFESLAELGGEERRQSAGGRDAFIMLLDPDGATRWQRGLGGEGWDEARAVALDDEGGLLVAGSFAGEVAFAPDREPALRRSSGDVDAFVASFSKAGQLRWVRSFGGAGADVASAAARTTAGEVVVAGWFSGAVDFDPGEGESVALAEGFSDGFVLALTSGGDFRWSWTVGGELIDQLLALSAGDDGGLWATGIFVDSIAVDTTPTPTQLDSRGRSDLVVLRLDEDGRPLWATAVGGEAADYGFAVAAAGEGTAVVGGRFGAEVDVDVDRLGGELSAEGASDGLVALFDGAGEVRWSRAIGGSRVDRVQAVAAVGVEQVVVAGSFEGQLELRGTRLSAQLEASGGADLFVARLGPR